MTRWDFIEMTVRGRALPYDVPFPTYEQLQEEEVESQIDYDAGIELARSMKI